MQSTSDSRRPRRRSLVARSSRPELGLVLTITLVAFEALAISTVMPLVADELGGIELYGWVFSAFFLGSLIGIVVVGGAIDRAGSALPFALGLGLFAMGLLIGGLAPSMPVLVAARFVQGLGPAPSRRSRTSRSVAEPARTAGRGCSRRCRPPGSCRRHRSGDCRHDRRDARLAFRLPGHAPAHRARRRPDPRRARAVVDAPNGSSGGSAHGRDRRRLPLALLVTSAPVW